jgi:ASC-1-like (ASCH) protein
VGVAPYGETALSGKYSKGEHGVALPRYAEPHAALRYKKMDHLAILAKKRNLLSKILSGEKTIESRWYKFKRTPYKSINEGDTVYFKDSGEPVTLKATVKKVLFYDTVDKSVFNDIISKYGKQICINDSYWDFVKDKQYVTLIFLKDVLQIKPFDVDKKGFGMMAAWITIDDIQKIRRDL